MANRTLRKMVEQLEEVRREVPHLDNDDMDMLFKHLRLLELKVMRIREKRRRENRD